MRYALSLPLLLILAIGQPAVADTTEDLLAELSNAHGPSGYEGPVRAIMRREMSALVTLNDVYELAAKMVAGTGEE